MGKHFTDTIPYPGDYSNVLLGKILQRLNGIASPGDTDQALLVKILAQLNLSSVGVVSAAELAYLAGVTSAIQAQLNAKQAAVGAASGLTKVLGTVYGAQNTPVTLAADTNAATVFTLVIPGGTIGPNGALLIEILATATNNANNKVIRVKYGAQDMAVASFGGYATLCWQRNIANRNSQASQVVFADTSTSHGISGASVNLLTVDTSVDVTLTVTAQKATAGDTLTIEYVQVRIIK